MMDSLDTREAVEMFKNLRSLVVYKERNDLINLLFFNLIPKLEEPYIIIYSNTESLILHNVYKNVGIKLENANVITVDCDFVPFGRRLASVGISELPDILKSLSGNILFFGFSILLFSEGIKRSIFDRIPKDCTFIAECHKSVYNDTLSLFFDVVFSIKADDFSLGECYILEVKSSSIPKLIPGFNTRFRGGFHEI